MFAFFLFQSIFHFLLSSHIFRHCPLIFRPSPPIFRLSLNLYFLSFSLIIHISSLIHIPSLPIRIFPFSRSNINVFFHWTINFRKKVAFLLISVYLQMVHNDNKLYRCSTLCLFIFCHIYNPWGRGFEYALSIWCVFFSFPLLNRICIHFMWNLFNWPVQRWYSQRLHTRW